MVETVKAIERRRSAAVRAIAHDPRAEFGDTQLTTNGLRVDFASPFMTVADNTSPAVMRGIGDALALVLRYNDRTLHLEMAPADGLQRLIFDMLEQLRCVALAPGLLYGDTGPDGHAAESSGLPGVQANLDAVAQAWCQHARANGVAENGVGLLIYTVAHMVRAELRLGPPEDHVGAIIEATRERLQRLIGPAVGRLPDSVTDQRAFAEASIEIAGGIAELAETEEFADGIRGAAQYQMFLPPDWLDRQHDGVEIGGSGVVADFAERLDLDGLGDYQVFTSAYDIVVRASDLYPYDERRAARRELDELVREQAVSPYRLALRLRRLFGTWTHDAWQFGVDEGIVDGRRLPQLIANPAARDIFQRPRETILTDTVVSILMDNSGSMKAQRYETLAVLVDTLSRSLDLAKVPHEILGHTTAAWSGGRARDDWVAAGKPNDVGRIAELCHVIYKDADTSWKHARHSLAAMQLTQHFRESIDGEAVSWAAARLLQRPERRKVLVVVSDGAPAEAATNKANRRGYLADHLTNVVAHIEQSTTIEIGALTVDQDMSATFSRVMPVDLDATLTIGAYGVFEELFG